MNRQDAKGARKAECRVISDQWKGSELVEE